MCSAFGYKPAQLEHRETGCVIKWECIVNLQEDLTVYCNKIVGYEKLIARDIYAKIMSVHLVYLKFQACQVKLQCVVP